MLIRVYLDVYLVCSEGYEFAELLDCWLCASDYMCTMYWVTMNNREREQRIHLFKTIVKKVCQALVLRP